MFRCAEVLGLVFSFLKDDGRSLGILEHVCKNFRFVVSLMSEKAERPLMKVRFFVENVHLMIWCLRTCKLKSYVCEFAAAANQWESLTVANRFFNCQASVQCHLQAAKNGHLELLKKLWEEFQFDGDYSGSCAMLAAENSHYDVVVWLYENCRLESSEEKCWQYILHCSAKSGDVRILRFVLSKPDIPQMTESTQSVAAYKGHVQFMDACKDAGFPLQSYLYQITRSLDVVKYLFLNNVPWHCATIRYYTELGLTELAEFARANGCTS